MVKLRVNVLAVVAEFEGTSSAHVHGISCQQRSVTGKVLIHRSLPAMLTPVLAATSSCTATGRRRNMTLADLWDFCKTPNLIHFVGCPTLCWRHSPTG
jgi:hypothetical protein